jgi:dTDP-4-dehydrorhamnose reductase
VKVTVIGASGQLGRDVTAVFAAAGDTVTPLGHDDVDVASAGSIKSALDQSRRDLVVNTFVRVRFPILDLVCKVSACN